MYLLDTMVVSESAKARPDPRVRAWLQTSPPMQHFVSALSFGEIAYGLARLPAGANKQRLQAWAAGLVLFFVGRILDVDVAVAERWALLRSAAGRSVTVIDSLIAATAYAHGLTVVTRNERDFTDLGVRVLNPWTQ